MNKTDQGLRPLPPSREYDVIILGAGPAGAVAASWLAQSGRDVLLLDRAIFPRFKVCGGCLNRQALAALSAAGLGNIPAELNAKPLKGLKFSTSKRSINMPLLGGQAISRTAFDHALIQAAQGHGVQFYEGITGQPISQSQRGWSLSVKNGDNLGTVKARALLVTTGLGSKAMADFVGRDNASQAGQKIWSQARLGGGTMIKDSCLNIDPNIIHMTIAPNGYVGMVRLEDNLVGVAAAIDADLVKSQKGLAQATAHIFKTAKQESPPELAEALWRGTPLLTRKTAPIAGERFLVAGDAAGYIEPFTGEGMAWAISSGLKAATLIHKGVDQWLPQISVGWESWHTQYVMRSQRRCQLIARALRQNWLVEASLAGLELMPFLARPIVNALDAPSKETIYFK